MAPLGENRETLAWLVQLLIAGASVRGEVVYDYRENEFCDAKLYRHLSETKRLLDLREAEHLAVKLNPFFPCAPQYPGVTHPGQHAQILEIDRKLHLYVVTHRGKKNTLAEWVRIFSESEIHVPAEMREAVEDHPTKNSDGYAAESKKSQLSITSIVTTKRTRQDPMALEIEEIYVHSPQLTAQEVMSALKERVGKAGSCVVAASQKGVEFYNMSNDLRLLTPGNLKQRLARHRKKIPF